MNNVEEKTSIASTICLNCIFADYNSEDVQTDCKADRLQLFEKHGYEIKDTEMDNKVCFVLEGKTCVYYRNAIWSKQYYKTDDISTIHKQVKKELKIPYHAIVFYRDTDSLEDLSNRLKELHSQEVKPKIVTVIDRSHAVEDMTGQIMKLFQKYSFDFWRTQRIQTVDQIDNDIIDLAYDSTKNIANYMFYIIFESSVQIPTQMSKDIHKSLHDDMKSFVVLLPNSQGVGKTVLKIAHRKYNGNSFTIPLEDKIIHYDDAPHLIKKVEDICPSLQKS